MSQDKKPLALAELEVQRAAEIASMVAELEGASAPSPAAFVASGESQGEGTHSFPGRFAASGKAVAKSPAPRPGRFIASGKAPAKRQG